MLPDLPETPSAEPVIVETPVVPERRPFWGYSDLAMVIGLSFGILAVAGLALFTIYRGQIPLTSPVVLVGSNLVLYVAVYLAFLAVFRLRYGKPVFASLGWVPARYSILLVVAAGIALAFLVSGVAQLLHTPKIDSEIERAMESKASLMLLGPMAITLAPLFEELFFRGFLQPLLSRSLGVIAGIVITAVAFGSLHGPEYNWAWQYVLMVTLVGAVLGWIRQWSGSVIPGTVLHATYNGVFVVVAALQHPK